MRNIFILLLLNLSLFAYSENFNAYNEGTKSGNLNDTGITFSSKGTWEVFTTPFSIFDTPVLLEPSSTTDNNPLTLSFKETQCQFSLDFATDGEDILNVIGLYRGKEVFKQIFSGENRAGSYVGTFKINTKLDSVKVYTKDKKRLLIDNIQTTSCKLDSYNLDERMIAHYSFEEDNTFEGVIGNALYIKEALEFPKEKDIKSIALWFRADDVQNAPIILQTNNLRVKVSINEDSFIQLDLDDAFFSPYISKIEISSRQWTYLVLTKDQEKLNIYINSELHGSFVLASLLQKDDEYIVLGDDDFGMMDEVRFYNRTLNKDEIVELYHTRETFTQSYTLGNDAGFKAGKQFCINNPKACGLQAGSTIKDISIEKDIKTLQGKTFDIEWYLWNAGGNTYLLSGDSNNSSIWQLVPDTRQWKPVHNAGTFDGFEGQDALFDSVTISEDTKQITFGNEINASKEN